MRTEAEFSLGSITTWLSGGTPNRANPSYWHGTIPWISAATLKGTRVRNSDQHITEAGVRAGSTIAPTGATLVLVRGMALHREARIGIASRPVSFNQDIKALVPKAGILPEYVVYALQARSAAILSLVSSAGSGTGVLNTQLLQRLPVWVPDEKTQHRIVAVIDSLVSQVETLEYMLAKKQAIKQGMTQQLLTGKRRLPGFAGEWISTEVGELLEFKNGLNKSSDYFGSGTPIINFMNVMNGPIVRPGDVNGRVTLTRDETNRFSAQRGDVFFTRTSETVEEVGTAAVLVDDILNACFSGFILRGRPRSTALDPRFLARAFQTSGVRAQVISTATYTTRALTNGRSLSRVVIDLPIPDEQRAIANLLDDVDAEVAALWSRLAKANDIKQGMMQELLTGRTRLPGAEGAV